MLDYVKKDGWFYRNAYPFGHKPTQVHICVMLWRLPIFWLFRILLSFCLWILIGLIGGAVARIILVPFWILTGSKFVRDPKFQNLNSTSWLIGERFLVPLCLLNYKVVPIETLPTIAGKKILPWHVVVAAAVPWMLWYVVPVAGSAAVSATHSIWNGITWTGAYFMELSLWIPLSLAVGTVFLALCVAGVHEFRKSEMYALMKMRAKARIDKVCPILPVR